MIRSMMLIGSCLLVLIGATLHVSADVITQENFKTHYRFNIIIPKDQVSITKSQNTVTLQTVNLSLFEQLSSELKKQNFDSQYINQVTYSQESFPQKPATIKFELKSEAVELFSFYRDPERKYILDFWLNNELLQQKSVALAKPLPLPNNETKTSSRSPIPLALKKPKKSILEVVEVASEVTKTANPDYRDFRYGASYIWDYQPLLPPLERDINLQSKIPDSLYPVKDRENLKDSREAHLQLSINFYRQEKFGLMNKSITLYEKKYGRNADRIVNDYLKVNSILRTNLAKNQKPLMLSAINLLSQILERTEDYQLKKAIYRFMLQYYVDQKDMIKSLELSKKFFVEARAEFDHEMVIHCSQVILHHLAMLKQNQKIQEFLEDKKLVAILPAQIGLAYTSYALLLDGKTREIIRTYEQNKTSLVKPVHPSILFNVAESYFREAQFDQAFAAFDEMIADYGHLLFTSYARTRLALIYDVTDKPARETLVLYKNAIDRATLADARYEAKVRLVALSLARKFKPQADDEDTEVFLEQTADEAKALTPELKKTLWLVRLRILINKQKYQEALAYLTSIPIDTLKPAEKRVFDGDGAEIVYGYIQSLYLTEDYSRAVKIWEVYRQKYETKVARNPFMNFLVAESYLRLGLTKSFDRALKDLELSDEVYREYPEWVKRLKEQKLADYQTELSLIKAVLLKDWSESRAKLASLPVSLRNSVQSSFYQGLVDYNEGKYAEASDAFEKVLTESGPKNQLSPRQMADLLMSYVESLYQLKDTDRFRTVVTALSRDIEKSKSAPILNIGERVNYLLIESLTGEQKPNYGEVEMLTRSFKTKFQKSPYISRIEYLLGISLIRNDKIKEGKSVLQDLISEGKAPGYIREMARTELSALELKNKKI
jgi:tetratricopeptide (TPR) repeat protein